MDEETKKTLVKLGEVGVKTLEFNLLAKKIGLIAIFLGSCFLLGYFNGLLRSLTSLPH